MISIAVHGAAGRMGLRLVALTCTDGELELAAAIDRADHASQGRDAATLAGIEPTGIVISDALDHRVDVVIDFTTPQATRPVIEASIRTGSNMVIGTTGLSDEDQATIDEAAKKIAILQSPNMSLGVNLLFSLAGQVAKRLGDDYDIEIVEAHHRFKVDAPSGTAMGIARAICQTTGKDLDAAVIHGRSGPNIPRRRGEIAVHALRSGDVVGRHTVSFGTLGEELQLTHVASTRDVFARGALAAAKWLAGKSPGRYHMADVLELDET